MNSTPSPTDSPTGLPVCAPEDYALSLELPGAAAGSVGYRVDAVGQSAACWLDTVLTITFVGADGQPLPIDGNGMTLPLVGDLPDGAAAGVLWSNWCGERESIRVELATPDHIVQSDQVTVPGCNGPGQPSTVSPIPDDGL
ncbi:MAG TPA: hypothetical protein VFV93_09725 [Thermomicrobiales bacterium]|nr:hypothetical protein [Thermomicrobiales bacterium]